SFAAEHAGSIWYGDVMQGPTLSFGGRRMKTYLVSLMDDASRLIAHSAFCLSETALDIEACSSRPCSGAAFHANHQLVIYVVIERNGQCAAALEAARRIRLTNDSAAHYF
ncbi:hypothetical protein L8949_41905, partial [Paraburkholderia caribensis]|nr:hypothetical protein [Paraburkholderia caribensis]